MQSTAPRATGILLLIEDYEKGYLGSLGGMLSSCSVKVYTKIPDTITMIVLMARKAGLSHIICTQEATLKKLMPAGREKKAKLSNYAGSIIPFTVEGEDTEFLILPPLKQLKSVAYGEFLTRRYIEKFTQPAKFRQVSEFNFKLCNDIGDYQIAMDWLSKCDMIAVDTETVKEPRVHMSMVGYTGWKASTGQTWSFVIPMKSMEAVHWMRKINALDIPKVLQNGKYDCAYFFLYSAPMATYLYDTANAFHAWYAELPKVLEAISAFFIRESMYWKDLADAGDWEDKCRYCALDTWATLESFLSWVAEAPAWAKVNYVKEFSIVPAAHMCEMTGIKRDYERLNEVADKEEQAMETSLASVRRMINVLNFNPSSPKQCLTLLHILGDKKAESSDEKQMQATSFLHPLNERILETILDYRGQRKLVSTYLSRDDNAKEYNGRILYSLNPHGTDTGRLASKEHHFWCGLQIQNIPKDGPVKETLIADEGFELWEADRSQAEDRGVAFCSGDPALLNIFESGVDSHSYKASMFFGLPIEEITKDLRQLGKRINHGSNYNMGKNVLVTTMGPKKVREAQRLLKLPKSWDLPGVAQHLLLIYEKTFPVVKKEYYQSIIKEVRTTKMLVGPTGWTRYCFGDPVKNKLDLNAYIAHKTQSLNAMELNDSFLEIFKELAFSPDFKLLAQIHDSVFFQVRKGHDYLAERVKQLMEITTTVTDCFGVERQMSIPVDLTKLGARWSGSE